MKTGTSVDEKDPYFKPTSVMGGFGLNLLMA